MVYAPTYDLSGLGAGIDSLADAAKDYQKRSRLAELGAQIQSGDYTGAAQSAFKYGDVGTGLKILQLGQDKEGEALALRALSGGTVSSSAPTQPAIAAPAAGTADAPLSPQSAADAIASIESRGSGNYNALGPVTKTGDQAIGRYQIMGNNVPEWTQAALGRSMTPQEFRSNPQAQDAVFQHRFGQYAQKYGPEGAARAWFAGEGGMNNPNARDQLGTTVSTYAQRFNAATGGGPVQVASSDPRFAPQVTPPATAAPVGQNDPDKQSLLKEQNNLTRALIVARSDGTRAAIKARLDQVERQLKESGEGIRTLSPDEVRTIPGIPEGYTGPVQLDRKGGLHFPLKPQAEVKIDQKGETAFAQASGTGLSKRFQDISAEGDTARQDMALLSQLQDLGQEIDTGAVAAAQGRLAQYGIKVGPKVDKIEAYRSVINKIAPQQRVPGSGTTSDRDLAVFMGSLPSLINTPDGNQIIVRTLGALTEDKLRRAQIAENALIGEISQKDAVKALQKLPSPFAEFKTWRGLGERGGTHEAAKPVTAKPSLPQGVTAGQALTEARDAIARNPEARGKIIDRLKNWGLDAGGL